MSLKRLFGGGPKSDSDFLPVDEAFVFSASSDSPDRITLRWDIADDYYLYRDKVKVTVAGADATLGTPLMPEGKSQFDDYFGEQVVYYGELIANVPVAAAAGTRELPIEVSYQGCADAGLCYPPTTKRVTVALASTGGRRIRPPQARAPHPRRRRWFPSRTRSRAGFATATCWPCSRRSSAPACCSPSRPACCRWCRFSPASSSARGATARSPAGGRSRCRSPT